MAIKDKGDCLHHNLTPHNLRNREASQFVPFTMVSMVHFRHIRTKTENNEFLQISGMMKT
jgi:hypothetical protein